MSVSVNIQVADNFVSPLLDAVLLDYQRNVASAREPEVLSTMAVIVDRLDVSFQFY